MAEPRTQGAQASPAAGTVLATTRNLPGGLVRVSWIGWGQAPFEALLEHVRGAVVQWGQIIPITTSLVVATLPDMLSVQPGDVIRIRTRSDVLGEAQMTLFVSP